MEADFWHERWAANKIGFHLDEVNTYLLQFWPALNLPQGSRVFVPLAGKSLDIVWLMQQGYNVEANELSELAVQAFFEEQQIEHTVHDWSHGKRYEANGLRFWCGNLFDLSRDELGQIDAVYDRAAFIALPVNMRPAYVEHIFAITRDVPHLLVTLEYDQSQMAGPPFGVQQQEVQTLYSPKFPQPSTMEPVLRTDVLPDHAHFAARGLTSLIECVYLLQVPKK